MGKKTKQVENSKRGGIKQLRRSGWKTDKIFYLKM